MFRARLEYPRSAERQAGQMTARALAVSARTVTACGLRSGAPPVGARRGDGPARNTSHFPFRCRKGAEPKASAADRESRGRALWRRGLGAARVPSGSRAAPWPRRSRGPGPRLSRLSGRGWRRGQRRVACTWVRWLAASANTRPAPKPSARRAASRVWPLVVTLSTK